MKSNLKFETICTAVVDIMTLTRGALLNRAFASDLSSAGFTSPMDVKHSCTVWFSSTRRKQKFLGRKAANKGNKLGTNNNVVA
jgi:hypothetical protein